MNRLRSLLAAVAAGCLLLTAPTVHAQKDLKTDSQGKPIASTPLNLSSPNVTSLPAAKLDGLTAAPARAKTLVVAPARTDGLAGQGTQEDPLDGGSPAKLEAILAAAPAGSTVTLLPGEYVIRPNPPTKWACRSIHGSGMYSTTLKLAVQSSSNYYQPFFSGATNYDSLEVSDLTFDLQAQLQPHGSVLSCSFNAHRGGFERVRVLNWGNSPASSPGELREAFGLVVGPADDGQESDLYIRDCVVEPALPSNYTGGGNSSLGINSYTVGTASSIPAAAMITGNVVNARPGDFGITLGGYCANVIVSGNRVRNAGRAIHQDTSMHDAGGVQYPSRNLLITGNTFTDCWPLLGLGSGGSTLIDGVQFTNNLCVIGAGSYSQYGGGSVFFLDRKVVNFTATDNRITMNPAKPFGAQDSPLLLITGGDNGVMRFGDNVIDGRFASPNSFQAADSSSSPSPSSILAWNNTLPSGVAFPAPFASPAGSGGGGGGGGVDPRPLNNTWGGTNIFNGLVSFGGDVQTHANDLTGDLWNIIGNDGSFTLAGGNISGDGDGTFTATALNSAFLKLYNAGEVTDAVPQDHAWMYYGGDADPQIYFKTSTALYHPLLLGGASVPIAQGGTGQTTASGAAAALTNGQALTPASVRAGNASGGSVLIEGVNPAYRVGMVSTGTGDIKFVGPYAGGYAQANFGNLVVSNDLALYAGITVISNGAVQGIFKGVSGGLGVYAPNGTDWGKLTAGKLNLKSLPTSASGLVSGDVWNDGGTLKVVP